jgi:hypothetical protein
MGVQYAAFERITEISRCDITLTEYIVYQYARWYRSAICSLTVLDLMAYAARV